MKINKILTLLMFFLTNYSCSTRVNENFEDIQKIKKGMFMRNVDSLMRNKPIKIRIADDNVSFYASYQSHFAASDFYYVEYRLKDSIVIDIYFGD